MTKPLAPDLPAPTAAAVRDVKRSRKVAPEDVPFEAVLLDRPDDERVWSAYQADLERRGDPRAALMRVERSVEGEMELRHGFAVSVRLSSGSDLAGRIDALRELRSTTLVRELVVPSSEPAVIRAIERWSPPSLQRLRLGEGPDVDLGARAWNLLALPRLVELELVGRVDVPTALVASRLRKLVVESTELSPRVFAAIAGETWPELEELVLWLGESQLASAPVIAFLAETKLPKLVALGICNTTLTNDVCRALAKGGLVSRLRRLDLSRGTMTDGGAAALGTVASRFANLELLDARENLLTPLGQEYVRRANAHARVEDQRPGYGKGERVPAVPHWDDDEVAP